jgi:hypothetical protein
MNSSNLSVAAKPAINFGVLFILGFALIVGTRPVRAYDPRSEESVTQSEPDEFNVSVSGWHAQRPAAKAVD